MAGSAGLVEVLNEDSVDSVLEEEKNDHNCRFRFGMEFQGPNTLSDPRYYDGIDYVTVWIGQQSDIKCDCLCSLTATKIFIFELGESLRALYLCFVRWLHRCASPPCFNPYWHGKMLDLARERQISVVYYAYIIAFLAKATGLNDCDVGSPSLCEKGANYIRENEPLILQAYARFANETMLRLGRNAEVGLASKPNKMSFYRVRFPAISDTKRLQAYPRVALLGRCVSFCIARESDRLLVVSIPAA